MKDSVLRLLKKSCIVKIIGLVFLFFGVNIYLSYATDSYYVLTTGFHGAAIDMVMRNGRPLIGLIYELHYLSGFSNISFYYISSALALIFLCASIWIYQEILKKYGIKENTRILLAFSAIVNIFIIEYFMFIEKCGFTLAVLFNVLAVYWMERVLSEQRKSCYVLAVITMTLAIFTYQGTVALFVILSIPFVMKNSKCFRHYISNGILLVGGYFIPAIIDLLAFKTVFKSTRIAEKTDYITSFKNVLSGIISNGKVTFNILPQYFGYVYIMV